MSSLGKKTLVGLEILRTIASNGYRIFTSEDAKESGILLGVGEKYTLEALVYLKKNKWIERIKRGVYAFTPESGLSIPPHEFEIAQAIAFPSAISHWTAMHFHNLTQQTPDIVYSTIPNDLNVPRRIYRNKYHFIRVNRDVFFGVKKVWIGEARIQIVDIEKTLLDGLRLPKYCGNFEEVIHAFKIAVDKGLDIQKIIKYALKLERTISKRLGYILYRLNIPLKDLKPLLEVPIKGFSVLNPNGSNKGSCNKKWMIVENI